MTDRRDVGWYPPGLDPDFERRTIANPAGGTWPAAFIVCPVCDGRGRHVNPNIDRDGLTADDFAADPDFKAAYLAGVYDVTCAGCRGLRVVLQPTDPADLAVFEEWQRDQAADRRTREQENG